MNFRLFFMLVVLPVIAICPFAQISATVHDLSVTGGGTIKATKETNICIFCHTTNTVFAEAPLWNKKTSIEGFSMYPTTIGGTTPDLFPNPGSLVCLSCHDGVSAVNNMQNAPGLVNRANFSMTAGVVTITGAQTNIGTDLRDDHPVSIVYDPSVPGMRPLNYDISAGGWLGGASTIQELLRNYGAGANRLECVSCHDPHNNVNTMFLRRNNNSSAMCTSCHDK